MFTKATNYVLSSSYDTFIGGVIEMEEFLLLLKNQHRLATKRLKELLVLPILSREADAITKEKYVPPRHGVLSLTVLDGFAKKENHR